MAIFALTSITAPFPQKTNGERASLIFFSEGKMQLYIGYLIGS